MIECPQCGISFSPSYANCPQCNKFETPAHARRAYIKADATDRIHDGDDPAEVRADLIANGLSDVEADELIRRESTSLARQNRGYGALRFATGVIMIAFGALTAGLAMLTMRNDAPVGLGGRTMVVMIVGGIIIFGLGLLAALSGVIATLTGKEPKIGPPT